MERWSLSTEMSLCFCKKSVLICKFKGREIFDLLEELTNEDCFLNLKTICLITKVK